MKRIVITCIFYLAVAACYAQITVKQTQQKIAQPVNIKTVSNPLAGAPQPTQGKDLKITIDRIDDISTLDQNNFLVNYTITNTGTEPVNLSKYYNGGIKGSIIENNNYVIPYMGGEAKLVVNGKNILEPGETLKGAVEMLKQNLNTGVTYKYILMVDNKNLLGDVNLANNTAESTITARAIKNGDYYLSSAKVTIQTGNDNKEANNSLMYYYVGIANYNESFAFSLGSIANGSGYTPEIKANSTTELLPNRSLDKNTNGLFTMYNSLCFYKQRGLALAIIYDNKAWATDAWKINSITLTIEFRDKKGTLYPNALYASKTITFPVNGLLGYRFGDNTTSNKDQIRVLNLGTDENFNPLPAEFKKYTGSPFLTVNSSLKNAPVISCY